MTGYGSMTCRDVGASAVPGAARASGVHADAVVAVDAAEHRRRGAVGLSAVPDLSTLHALMCLPLHAAVPVADLDDVVRRLLERAPAGCVDWSDDRTVVQRRFVPAAVVSLVVVRAATWRSALRRAAAFAQFSARVVLLTRPPRRVADLAWEADVDGAGLWIARPDEQIEEIVAPAPYTQRYVKPAGWRFAENAYGAWLSHEAAQAPSGHATATPQNQ